MLPWWQYSKEAYVNSRTKRVLTVIAILALMIPALAGAQTLNRVRSRGRLVCGVNGSLPGFSNLNSNGSWSGFDVDYCRAIAAAVFGDGNKVEFVPLTAAERFTALQTGEIDVLIRNTTWTLSRDTQVGADFAPTTFFDGQGFMVRRSIGVTNLSQLNGASICVTSGTTTELNLADVMRARGINYTPVVFEELDTVYNSYEQGRCDAVTSDKSQLSSRRAIMTRPADHVILDATISKEPLGPLTAHGDNQWNDVVSWVVYATFFAEEYGLTKANVGTSTSTNPEIQRFLGSSGNLGSLLGLSARWARDVVSAVGNYNEIFQRNLTPLGLPRGVNSLWTNGGLLYPIPFR